MLQAVHHCRQWASSPGAIRVVFFYHFLYFYCSHFLAYNLKLLSWLKANHYRLQVYAKSRFIKDIFNVLIKLGLNILQNVWKSSKEIFLLLKEDQKLPCLKRLWSKNVSIGNKWFFFKVHPNLKKPIKIHFNQLESLKLFYINIFTFEKIFINFWPFLIFRCFWLFLF